MFSCFSGINIDLEQAFWEKPNTTECKLLEELPNNILDLHDITITDGKLPDISVTQWIKVECLYLDNVYVGCLKNWSYKVVLRATYSLGHPKMLLM